MKFSLLEKENYEKFFCKEKIDSVNRKTVINGECHEFNGQLTNKGYGHIVVGRGQSKKRILAHRWSFMLHNKTILERLDVVMHKCDNPKCINPDHLSLGTMKQNTKDMIRKGRNWNQKFTQIYCKRGHRFQKRIIKNVMTKNICLICQNLRRAIARRNMNKNLKPYHPRQRPQLY